MPLLISCLLLYQLYCGIYCRVQSLLCLHFVNAAACSQPRKSLLLKIPQPRIPAKTFSYHYRSSFNLNTTTMGKGQGKKGRREAKTTAKKAKKAKLAAKIPKVRPPNPINKARKELSRKNSLLKINPLETTEVPTGPPKIHAKWPALFKKHIGIIESHIKSLDRVMQSMKSEMAEMSEKERMEWELGERGNWRVMCALMDRSRELLTSARTAAKGIVSFGLLHCFQV